MDLIYLLGLVAIARATIGLIQFCAALTQGEAS